ncbi:MAG TPA: serine hydrolase [Flavobacteriaceae bacterium]|nr:serine hydrolase [Flavobacteriaceae bacterium]
MFRSYPFRKFSVRIILILFLVAFFQSCQVGKMIVYNFADIKDHKKFPNRTVETDSTKFFFPKAVNPTVPKKFTKNDSSSISFERFLENHETVAFLIIKNDSLYYEEYFDGYSQESVVPSFSMAKSVLSILVGMAIEDGYISSVQDPVTKYIPEMKSEKFGQITLENLLQMTSGIQFTESYWNPFGDAAAFYYGRNLVKKTKRLKVETPPGTQFDYASGNSQILGLVLSNALPEDTTLSEYLERKLWKPLGMEYNATWSLDEKNGIEKTFCCLNARAIDYAKIGRLYLREGNWNKKQLVPKNWVETSTKVDTTNASPWFYQHQWWLPTKNGDFMAKGILGQFIYVNPNKDLIMVRLGKDYGEVDWTDIFVGLAAQY